CSRSWISGNPGVGGSAVSKAGSKVFSSYGSDNMFFLDFVDGNNKRAFPGIVLMDKSWSTGEEIVLFRHLPTAIKMTKSFSEQLQNSGCSNQGLAVYLATVAASPDRVASGGGGKDVAAGVGIAGTVATAGMGLALTGGIAAKAGVIMSFGVGAGASVPVAGWIVGIAAGVVGGILSLVPPEIAKIEKITILDGPYTIR
ncbi:hypothetical protein LJC18_05025, partial [Lachnospiraceae bacterium OttesenSCG-928-E19]|nr:hypothetical protein [Lachnospiraceae bacterium OttesenSCG-928-E19]